MRKKRQKERERRKEHDEAKKSIEAGTVVLNLSRHLNSPISNLVESSVYIEIRNEIKEALVCPHDSYIKVPFT